MNPEIAKLKGRADSAKALFKNSIISYEELKAEVMPYIVVYNEKSIEIAKKYNIRPRMLRFQSYIR